MKRTWHIEALLCTVVVVASACGQDRSRALPGALHARVAEEDRHPAPRFGPWSTVMNLGPVINSTSDDQHPAISHDGLSLYISSNRPGGHGGFDIWVSKRKNVDSPWGPPVNLGSNINSAGNDSSPTFSRDGLRLYFHSSGHGAAVAGQGCGDVDLFVSRREDEHDDFGWQTAENLGCFVNSPFSDSGPTVFEDEESGITTLYFTSTRPGGPGDFDIWASTRAEDEKEFSQPMLVKELSSPFRDTRTAIRGDGLEIFLSSGRPGDDVVGRSMGSEDLWVSRRPNASAPWSPPENLGPTVNSTAFDGAPALSRDGTTLYFFSERAGGLGGRDLYVTTRSRIRHSEDSDE
jgi:hypothetical protein